MEQVLYPFHYHTRSAESSRLCLVLHHQLLINLFSQIMHYLCIYSYCNIFYFTTWVSYHTLLFWTPWNYWLQIYNCALTEKVTWGWPMILESLNQSAYATQSIRSHYNSGEFLFKNIIMMHFFWIKIKWDGFIVLMSVS